CVCGPGSKETERTENPLRHRNGKGRGVYAEVHLGGKPMSLFWREQTPLIIFYLIQLSLFPLIYWLEGCKEWSAPLYSAFLSFFLLACYLTYRYASHRAFYCCLTSDSDSLESTLQ